jgi:hypothetical protein
MMAKGIRVKETESGCEGTKAEMLVLEYGAERGRVNKDISWMLDVG